MKEMYLVTVFWTQRSMETYYTQAHSESHAIMTAVERNCIDSDELYDHTKSRATLFNPHNRE